MFERTHARARARAHSTGRQGREEAGDGPGERTRGRAGERREGERERGREGEREIGRERRGGKGGRERGEERERGGREGEEGGREGERERDMRGPGLLRVGPQQGAAGDGRAQGQGGRGPERY